MKSLILICLVAFAAADPSEECMSKKLALSRAAETCMDANGGTPLEIYEKFKPIALQYTDTDTEFTALDTFLNEYCVHFQKSVQCLLPSVETPAECPHPDETEMAKMSATKLKLKGMHLAAQYMCANHGEVVKHLIPNNGLKYFFSNPEFKTCIRHAFEATDGNMVCPVIDSTTECVKNTSKVNYPNTYIPVVGQHFRDEWQYIGKC